MPPVLPQTAIRCIQPDTEVYPFVPFPKRELPREKYPRKKNKIEKWRLGKRNFVLDLEKKTILILI